MKSEEEIKNCTTNGVPNETVIRSLMSELETYKRALHMACKNCLGCLDCEGQIDCSDKSCVECFKEYYLQKAREEND